MIIDSISNVLSNEEIEKLHQLGFCVGKATEALCDGSPFCLFHPHYDLISPALADQLKSQITGLRRSLFRGNCRDGGGIVSS